MAEGLAARRRTRRGAVLVLIGLVASAGPAVAQAERSYWIERFDVDLTVAADATLEVTEHITFRFAGSFNGIYRDISYRYRTPWGLDYRIEIGELTVTDDLGSELRHEASRNGDDLRVKVWVPRAVDAARQVQLRYRVRRALRFPEAEEGFTAHDQLYWNATGNRWTVPIAAASAHVRLPSSVLEEPLAVAYAGPYGSREAAVIVSRPVRNEVRFEMEHGLAAGEGLTIVVGWPPGSVARPTAMDAARDLVGDNWPLALPVVVLVVMVAVFRRHGRDPDVGRSVMVRYEPPEGLRPAEIGALVDERVDLRDIVATVVDLAVRGYLRIEERGQEGWFGDSTITTLVRLRAADDELRPWERTIHEGLFERGDRVELDELKSRFYEHVGPIRTALYEGLTGAGWFRARPDHVRNLWFGIAVAAAIGGVVAGVAAAKVAFFFAGPLVGLVVGGFAPFMPARTRAGRREYLRVKGFEEFLGRTEATRFRELQLPEATFERYLPYAMALGVADHWAGLFRGLLQGPPQWYAGPTGSFDSTVFSQRMQGMGSRLGTAMATAPRSSSGSSGFSSGGGFSGGGFGGGGGGAF